MNDIAAWLFLGVIAVAYIWGELRDAEDHQRFKRWQEEKVRKAIAAYLARSRK